MYIKASGWRTPILMQPPGREARRLVESEVFLGLLECDISDILSMCVDYTFSILSTLIKLAGILLITTRQLFIA